ncbi:kinase-like domain-containing protein [Cercophora scortea]|uniref:Kinase-like domain-containing protein n=1 Tax=Cercophora scortea TaxID=314031 RepID=A0AAE0M763_9PEZI|nr:kinase-like domain-containing protein [Cercophora scortea]
MKAKHNHIVRPLTTWEHDKRYYMIQPLAEWDLSNYMARWETTSTISPDERCNVLKQLYGLATALREVHGDGAKVVGTHMDIKLENVLVFSTGGGPVTFKLTDFGCANIGQMDPRDIWSLGAMMLEILVWLIRGPKLDAFRTKRGEEFEVEGEKTQAVGAVEDDMFYYFGKDGKPHLKPVVIREINDLKVEVSTVPDPTLRKPLMVFLNVIEMMLKVPKDERPTAKDVCAKLKAI